MPLFFAYGINRFSHDVDQSLVLCDPKSIYYTKGNNCMSSFILQGRNDASFVPDV